MRAATRGGARGRIDLSRCAHVVCSTRSTRTPRACRPGSSPEGSGASPGTTMSQRRQWFLENSDEIRTLLMYEPRGHASMSGAILQPPTRPDADWGVLYIEVSGCLPMCGHGTIGVATVLVETGMVEVTEPVTTIRLDTPAGLVTAEVAVEGGAARNVTIRNVPSFTDRLDAEG